MADVPLYLNNAGGSEITLKFEDKLYLHFQVAGYFKTNHADDFFPKLPNDFCDVGVLGPYSPKKHQHNTPYCFDPNEECDPDMKKGKGPLTGFHAIHTSN